MNTTEPVRHIDKTRQDKMPVDVRARVQEWRERLDHVAMFGDQREHLRIMLTQLPRLTSGHFALRHLNSYLRNRAVVDAR